MNDKVIIELDDLEKRVLLELIYDKIDYGADLGYARKLIQLYDKIKCVENSVNE